MATKKLIFLLSSYMLRDMMEEIEKNLQGQLDREQAQV